VFSLVTGWYGEARSGQTRRADRRCADSVVVRLAAALVFCSEILLEYVFLPDAAMKVAWGGSSSERVCAIRDFGVLCFIDHRIDPGRALCCRRGGNDLFPIWVTTSVGCYVYILGTARQESVFRGGGRL